MGNLRPTRILLALRRQRIAAHAAGNGRPHRFEPSGTGSVRTLALRRAWLPPELAVAPRRNRDDRAGDPSETGRRAGLRPAVPDSGQSDGRLHVSGPRCSHRNGEVVMKHGFTGISARSDRLTRPARRIHCEKAKKTSKPMGFTILGASGTHWIEARGGRLRAEPAGFRGARPGGDAARTVEDRRASFQDRLDSGRSGRRGAAAMGACERRAGEGFQASTGSSRMGTPIASSRPEALRNRPMDVAELTGINRLSSVRGDAKRSFGMHAGRSGGRARRASSTGLLAGVCAVRAGPPDPGIRRTRRGRGTTFAQFESRGSR